MKMTRTSKHRSFILGVVLVVGPGYSTSAFADFSYLVELNIHTATKLGNLGGSNTIATALNDAAQVVGYFTTVGGSKHAFIAGPHGAQDGRPQDLRGSHSYAQGINDAEQVVGESQESPSTTSHAFITGADGVGMRDLNLLAALQMELFNSGHGY